MTVETTDVFVSGAGIAGLVAAAGFARAGFRVVVADPAPPPSDAADDAADLRSTAYLQPSCGLLEKTGLWDSVRDHATPLRALRVIDDSASASGEPTTRLFFPEEADGTPFGWNIPNWLMRRTLSDHLAGQDRISLRLGTGFSGMLLREKEALVTLSDGARLRARLVIGADGRGSPVRQAAGIDAQTTRYGQNVLAFVATHDLPHEEVSSEIYRSGGAFTLVPMPDLNGQPASAVVWMNAASEADRLLSLAAEDFNAAMTERSTQILGNLCLEGGRRMWPVITQTARHLTARRTALVAEAAHVMPPIGAQGLNTSLHDVRALLQHAEKAPDHLGGGAMLAAYERDRARDVHLRATAIDLFNRVCKSAAPPVQALRRLGLAGVHDIAFVRRTVMRAGLGPRSGAPEPR